MASRKGNILSANPDPPLAGRAETPGHSHVWIVTAGVPCQDVSVAGKRAGLAGTRTGLFFEFARVLREVRPAWFVFENVPGLLSSNQAETLRKCSAFSWSNAGTGFRGACSIADFSESPSAAVECSLSEVLESRVPRRFFLSPRAAAGILRRAEKRGRILPSHLQAALESLATRPAEGAKTISTSRRRSAPNTPKKPIPEVAIPQSPTLSEKTPEESGRGTTPPTPSPETCGIDLRGREATFAIPSVPCVADPTTTTRKATTLCPTLAHKNEPCNSAATREEMMVTMATLTMSVRRLTPTECETLQGFPKGWTLPAIAGSATPSRSKSSSGSSAASSARRKR